LCVHAGVDHGEFIVETVGTTAGMELFDTNLLFRTVEIFAATVV
jgi:hypothetical protein